MLNQRAMLVVTVKMAVNNELSVGQFTDANVMTFTASIQNKPVIPNEVISSLSKITSLRLPIDTPKYYMSMTLYDYHRDSLTKFGRAQKTLMYNITLPLPTKLVDSNQVKYDDHFELGLPVGYALGLTQTKTKGDAIGNLFSVEGLNATLNAGSSTFITALRTAATTLGLGSNLVQLLTDKSLSLANDVARVTSGYSPNQFLTVLLDGPTYKKYDVSFVLSPNKPQESENLKEIINLLNNSMAPKLSPSTQYFEFPKIFQLGLHPNSAQLFKYKPAVLESFDINYTPNQQPVFLKASKDTNNYSTPETVQLTLTFLELEFWLRTDFIDNNDTTDTLGPRNT